MTLVSGSIRLMRIFAEVPRGGASNDSAWACRDYGNFQRFRWLFFRILTDEASVIIGRYADAVRRRLFSDPKMLDLE